MTTVQKTTKWKERDESDFLSSGVRLENKPLGLKSETILRQKSDINNSIPGVSTC